MRNSSTRKNSGGMSLAPWLGIVLLAFGVGIGWGSHVYLSQSDTQDLVACPKLPEPIPTPACPAAADAEPAEGDHLPVYASEVTGEGVIEFKFYGPDGTQVTRKWITRIPLSAPDAVPAPDGAYDESQSSAPAEEKPAASPVEKSDTPPPTKTMAKPEPKASPAAKPKDTKSTSKPTVTKPTSGKGKFTVQTGAYKDRESAEAQVAKLERRGFDARIEKAVIPGKGTWYRVRVGVSLAQSDANALATKIRKSAGLEASAVTQ